MKNIVYLWSDVFTYFTQKTMNTRLAVVLAFCFVLTVGCMKKGGSADNGGGISTADSMKAAWTALQTAFDAGKVDEFDKYVGTNMVEHNPMPGQGPGLAGLKAMATGMKIGFPDQKSTTQHGSSWAVFLLCRSQV